MEDGPWRCFPPSHDISDVAQCVCGKWSSNLCLHVDFDVLCRLRILVPSEPWRIVDCDAFVVRLLRVFCRVLVRTIVQDDGRKVVAPQHDPYCVALPWVCLWGLLRRESLCLVCGIQWSRPVYYHVLVSRDVVWNFRSVGLLGILLWIQTRRNQESSSIQSDSAPDPGAGMVHEVIVCDSGWRYSSIRSSFH